jgi:hypothetical protein
VSLIMGWAVATLRPRSALLFIIPVALIGLSASFSSLAIQRQDMMYPWRRMVAEAAPLITERTIFLCRRDQKFVFPYYLPLHGVPPERVAVCSYDDEVVDALAGDIRETIPVLHLRERDYAFDGPIMTRLLERTKIEEVIATPVGTVMSQPAVYHLERRILTRHNAAALVEMRPKTGSAGAAPADE